MGDNRSGKAIWWDAFSSQAPGIFIFAAIAFGFLFLGMSDEGSLLESSLVFVFGSIIYLIPAVVAYMRKHNNRAAIIMLNILLGWTLIGWVGALVWAMTKDVEGK